MVSFVLMLAGLAPIATETTIGLEELARADDWQRALEVAVRRQAQLPLRPEEALIAAYAAHLTGETTARKHFLEIASASTDLGAVARVELASLVVEDDPDRALGMVIDLLRRAPTDEIRDAALQVAGRSVDAGLGATARRELERRLTSVSRARRRPVELALARSAQPVDRARMSRLLASSTRDLVALAAAEDLEASGALGAVDRWRVAKAYYNHGLYDRAAPIFESLDGVSHTQIPSRDVAYLRGRCAFRRGDWPLALTWYKKAASRSPAGERRAEIEMHLARTYELEGDLDQAVAAAQRAVRLKTTDDRRLLLARLRLHRDEPELAMAGLSRLRGRTNRSRGELMLGLHALRKGDDDSARRHLRRVSRDPWRGPAAVFRAGLDAAAGNPEAALGTLDSVVGGLNEYWASQARALLAELPQEAIERWRQHAAREFVDPVERTRRRAMAGVVKLDPDPEKAGRTQRRLAADVGLAGPSDSPDFRRGVAGRLWSLGLRSEAVRWDPKGMPRDNATASWWTALVELDLGQPRLAISAADTARWQASSLLPPRGLPEGLKRALYPLPYREMVFDAAVRHRAPWTLLAGVAREESRWNPMVVSKVGARGLMQLMPATGAATAKANGRPEILPDDLFEPLISLDLGAAELARLLEVFDGNRAAAVAAYNAGEAQARLWLVQCGAGCSEARYLAGVSFSVTRGYTEAVLASAAFYEELYGSSVTARSE